MVVGIGLSALGVALSVVMDQILLAIISFLGSMGIKDAVTIQTTINHDIKSQKSCWSLSVVSSWKWFKMVNEAESLNTYDTSFLERKYIISAILRLLMGKP